MTHIVHTTPAMVRTGGAQWTTLVSGLTDALQTERRLIEDLIVAMRRQREGVAADDLQSVDDSVFAVQRILLTLGEARKRRRTLNTRLGQSEDIGLRDLLEILGPHVTTELRAAREALQQSAQMLARDVATNRAILREALAHGEEVVRTLAGVAPGRVGYGEGVGVTAAPAHASYLVNRRA